MVGKSHSHTKAGKRRFIDLQMVGCICTRLDGNADDSNPEPADIHHIVLGGKRLGHAYTLPLSPWFHRGVVPSWCASAEQAEYLIGPSLARNKRAFTARYGTELELLGIVDRHLARLRRRAA